MVRSTNRLGASRSHSRVSETASPKLGSSIRCSCSRTGLGSTGIGLAGRRRPIFRSRCVSCVARSAAARIAARAESADSSSSSSCASRMTVAVPDDRGQQGCLKSCATPPAQPPESFEFLCLGCSVPAASPRLPSAVGPAATGAKTANSAAKTSAPVPNKNQGVRQIDCVTSNSKRLGGVSMLSESSRLRPSMRWAPGSSRSHTNCWAAPNADHGPESSRWQNSSRSG